MRRAIEKIGALFTDYDGTIAPLGVSRRGSRVPDPILSRLVELSSKIPIAIITSKDYNFIEPRTNTFAKAWASVSGLDIRLAGGSDDRKRGSSSGSSNIPDIEPILRRMTRELPKGVVVEPKRASNKDRMLLGFSIDWTAGPRFTRHEVSRMVRKLQDDDLHVSYSPWQSYMDAFVAKPSKGTALRILAKQFGVPRRTVVYLGDSEQDNDAFDSAGISIGVDHGQSTESLRCSYLLGAYDVGAFLGSLSENDLHFSPGLLSLK